MRAVLVQTHTSGEKGKRSGRPQTQRHATLQVASQTSLRITRLFPSRPGPQADDPEPSAWGVSPHGEGGHPNSRFSSPLPQDSLRPECLPVLARSPCLSHLHMEDKRTRRTDTHRRVYSGVASNGALGRPGLTAPVTDLRASLAEMQTPITTPNSGFKVFTNLGD